MKRAYEGEFIYLFEHYFSSDSMSVKTQWQSATLYKNQKTSQWT